ncbi:Crp/Fnr family transcriptional regulator [Mucilaginibacter sp. SMC90]|uniref:Crp/Fnr family transcriptional regulator n=1 Tax=Mucilaginibacter sp. SMC90 TaxID=2929803 RepID=UPI001FB1E754|nr:Crp/Fnr family transcriptional regulator [Mucilaginibacter sp. SMC90]UOE50849.1 Crp/Fnr family transcriptional regulator [Mucilaginibacter sp. SMC90]
MIEVDDISPFLDLSKKLTEHDYTKLKKFTKVRRLRPGEVYIAAGSSQQRIALISNGILRAYLLEPSGDEITIMLRCENQIVASIDSILLNKPSRFYYEAIEHVILIELDYQRAMSFIESNNRLFALRHQVLLGLLLQTTDRLEDFMLLKPQERYIRLITQRPYIANRVPDKYLSTMLGITPVSLSRIKKRLKNKLTD